MTMATDFDVAVAGAGPAGTSAAIFCRKAGLTVGILEGQAFPRFRPGELLHPGVETLLNLLDVTKAVKKIRTIKVRGIWSGTETQREFAPFGADDSGIWVGLQIERATLDEQLLKQARSAGCAVLQPCYVTNVERRENQWVIVTRCGEIRARILIDAAGSNTPIRGKLGLKQIPYSPRIIAKYGYGQDRASKRFNPPIFIRHKAGWAWIAQVDRERFQWITASWDFDSPGTRNLPNGLLHLDGISRMRGADVTWRVVNCPALPGYFCAGDAAAVLDPSSSHGVVRALASGIKAGFLAGHVTDSAEVSQRVAAEYCQWLRRWFEHDVRALRNVWAL
jgi:flavin-dependent dehydrogenase